MDVRLVTSTMNDDVHATTNDKKTGCGVNLMKAENATKYRRGGLMTALGEITCEKCRAKIAKEMIKADKKEMDRIMKEEKARAKRGGDDDLVQLSKIEQKPTSVQPVAAPEPEIPAAPAPQALNPAANAAMTDDLAQFAINKPVQPEPETAQQDDFLAQFSVNKPEEPEEEPAPAQEDDFLAQFAINKPQDTPSQPDTSLEGDDFLAQFAVSSAPQEEPEPVQPEPAKPEVLDDIDDIMQAFSIGNNNNNNINIQPHNVEIVSQDDAPTPGMYDNDDSVIDVEDTSALEPVQPVEPAQPVQLEKPASVQEDEEIQASNEWDAFASQFFGDVSQPAPAPQPVQPEPVQPAPAPVQPEPVQPAPAPVQPEILEMDDLPMLDDLAAPPPARPVTNDISVPAEEPIIDEITVPGEIELPEMDYEEDLDSEDESYDLDEDDIEIDDIEFDDDDEDDFAPIIPPPAAADTPVSFEPAAPPQPVERPVEFKPAAAPPPPQPVERPVEFKAAAAPPPPQPVQPAPAPQPAPVQQPVQPAPAPQPAPVQQPSAPYVQPAAQNGQPQIIMVPTYMGNDANGQPIYNQMPMQLLGYDQNGQMMLAPIPGQTPQYVAPVAPVQPAQTAAPSMSRPKKPVQTSGVPTANISKISTNPHKKQTSQSFINAIADSRSYENETLTDTQGLKAHQGFAGSVEDALAMMGDTSAKNKKVNTQKQGVPTYSEFTMPTKNKPSSPKPASRPAPKPEEQRPLTKKELKEKKKAEKEAEKFRKKNGL